MALSGHQASNTVRSFDGCWTCRLRRKKCDERRPVCETCASLYLTCHFGPEKPQWMDGGAKQEQMAARFKQEVRDGAQRRREGRVVDPPGGFADADVVMGSSSCENSSSGEVSSLSQQQQLETPSGSHCALLNRDGQDGVRFGQSDTILITFYLETVLPFLFPFYRPSISQGGRAWVLEMLLNSPVVRRATLCLSPYFLSLVRDTNAAHANANANANGGESETENENEILWDAALAQTRDAFVTLGQALQVVNDSGIRDHLHGAVRIMASIVQLQRFEIAVLGFDNCRAHHSAALALLEQILDSTTSNSSSDGVTVTVTEPRARFEAVLHRLGPSASASSSPFLSSSINQFPQVPSAEQTAFLFSSALILHNDIIASTVLQERPRLYEYHTSLLNNTNQKGLRPFIDLEVITGCQNWVHVQIAEISVLDAWKQQCKRAGDLDVMELVRRAAGIKCSLDSGLEDESLDTASAQNEHEGLLDMLVNETGDYYCSQTVDSSSRQTTAALVTRVWVHAALLYLSVVVSGWQPANSEVRYHVSRIIELLLPLPSNRTSSSFFSQPRLPPLLLRTMAWPFCVAGCLAGSAQEVHFRGLVERLKPPSAFGTVYKALEVMERVWQNRDTGDVAAGDRDFAACFRCEGNLVLLA